MGSSLSQAFLGLILLTLFGAGASACDEQETTATVIVGITSDFMAGSDLARLEVETRADGTLVEKNSIALGASAGRTRFPIELTLADVKADAQLTVLLTGYDSSDVMRVVRRASTTAVAGPTRLVRVHLDALCRLEPAGANGGGAPTCDDEQQTCIAGQCSDAFIDPAEHEPYSKDWAADAGDACKPAGAGDPIVIVGTGMSDYFAAEDYELAEVEAGSQGGHHIWIATRVKNLLRSGSITEVGAEIPSLGVSVPARKVIFTLDPDEGGFCKLFGLRLQLDVDGNEIEPMLGQEVRISVTITDSDGDVGEDDLWVTLSETII